MDLLSPQTGELLLPIALASEPAPPAISAELAGELYQAAEAASLSLSRAEFALCLESVAARLNFGLSLGAEPDPAQRSAFLRSLKLPELALAHACTLGHEAAWTRFLALYRAPLTQAAIAITGSATLGHDLADSLYAELYGLRASTSGGRRSPLASYSGRGSLLGWLRATLAQRHVDHHRRSHRESPLNSSDTIFDPPAPTPAPQAIPAELTRLTHALARTLQALPGEDRLMLAAYFLDRQTLLQIARILHVHEATVSRRIKRLTADLRRQLLQNLQSGGLSQRAAEEALGTDPRDLEINLRALLQTSQTGAFSNERPSPPAPNDGRL